MTTNDTQFDAEEIPAEFRAEADAVAADAEQTARIYDTLSDVTANATVTMSGEIPDRYLEEFDEDDFVPPERAQDKAQRILDIREEQDNVNGGTDTGWSRAEQIAAGIPIPPDEVGQISAWFARHPKSEASDAPDDEPWTDNGWTARMLWGWDQAKRWADALSERLDTFEEQTDNLQRRDVLDTVGNATRYSESDPVQTPQGFGIVTEVRTEDFEGKNGTVEASESSPTYVVGLQDARVGVEFYSASELSPGELPETDVENPVGDATEQAANASLVDNALRRLGLTANDWTMPPSWRKADTPARLILLDAWSSMGGQFDCNGGCCMGEMLSSGMSNRAASQFCASMKDEVLGGWEGWRKGG